MKNISLSKQEKILLSLFQLSKGTKKNLTFEDIVVAIYRKFPQDFHLKGYEEYPDADLIRRPLYTFRDHGILLVRNMIFSLTDKGIDEASRIKAKVSRKNIQSNEKFDRYVEKEIRRIRDLSGFSLYINNKLDNIFDTNFFDYLGVSVKSDRIEFKSRLKIVSDVAKTLKDNKDQELLSIYGFHNFMVDKFKEIINYKLKI